MQNKSGKLIVVSGFSGAGKGTIVNHLIDHYKNYALSISATSRKKRPTEIEDIHYFFISEKEFENLINNDGLLEYTKYNENYYGTPKSFVIDKLNSGENVILEIEINGAMNVKKKYSDAVLIFVTTPSFDALYQRLKNRNTETEEQIRNRLKIALAEASGVDKYDYVIINEDVEVSAGIVDGIINDNQDTINKLNNERDKTLKTINEIKESIEKFVK